MSYGQIYKITNLTNGMLYVGQTTKLSISDRFSEHCKERRNNRHISNAIRKHGKDNFTIESIAIAANQTELNALEVSFVTQLNAMFPSGYNHRAGGEQNGICSDVLKQKISAAKMNKPNLKRRGEVRTSKQRLMISRSLGGQAIKVTNVRTNRTFILPTAHAGRKCGFNPSNIVQICKKTGRRQTDHGHTFEYFTQANQSGSSEDKKTEHAQRIEIDPTSVD